MQFNGSSNQGIPLKIEMKILQFENNTLILNKRNTIITFGLSSKRLKHVGSF